MLKIKFFFKKNTNFTGEKLKNSYDLEYEIFKVVFLCELEYVARFSKLH